MINRKEMEILTVRGVADMLNLHANTVRKWSDQGVLKSIRIGPRSDRRFSRQDIIEFVNGQQAGLESLRHAAKIQGLK